MSKTVKRKVVKQLGALAPGESGQHTGTGLRLLRVKDNSVSQSGMGTNNLGDIPVVVFDSDGIPAFDGYPADTKVEVEEEVEILTWPDLEVGEMFFFEHLCALAKKTQYGYTLFGNGGCFDGRRDVQVTRVKVVPVTEDEDEPQDC